MLIQARRMLVTMGTDHTSSPQVTDQLPAQTDKRKKSRHRKPVITSRREKSRDLWPRGGRSHGKRVKGHREGISGNRNSFLVNPDDLVRGHSQHPVTLIMGNVSALTLSSTGRPGNPPGPAGYSSILDKHQQAALADQFIVQNGKLNIHNF